MDKINRERRSKNMSAIKSKNTKPELIIRKYLFSKGIRYKVNYKIPGQPDIVFPKQRIAVFIHGCFWHQHTCVDGHIPRSNLDYWEMKLRRNVARDETNILKLKKQGWKTLVLWECNINTDFIKEALKIIKLMKNEKSIIAANKRKNEMNVQQSF